MNLFARRAWALGLSLTLVFFLSACASSGAKKTATPKKHVPTPAERLAIKHYKLGIDAYANDKYAEAINHWKVTLANDPENPNAAEYIGRAENMLKAVKGAKKRKAPKPTPTPALTAEPTKAP